MTKIRQQLKGRVNLRYQDAESGVLSQRLLCEMGRELFILNDPQSLHRSYDLSEELAKFTVTVALKNVQMLLQSEGSQHPDYVDCVSRIKKLAEESEQSSREIAQLEAELDRLTNKCAKPALWPVKWPPVPDHGSWTCLVNEASTYGEVFVEAQVDLVASVSNVERFRIPGERTHRLPFADAKDVCNNAMETMAEAELLYSLGSARFRDVRSLLQEETNVNQADRAATERYLGRPFGRGHDQGPRQPRYSRHPRHQPSFGGGRRVGRGQGRGRGRSRSRSRRRYF